jgi:hypothetical protein
VPIVLTANTGVPGPTAGALTRIAPRTMSVLGGPGVVTDATVGQLAAYLR